MESTATVKPKVHNRSRTCHVKPGSTAKKSRRQSAAERLEKHLSNHPVVHNELVKDFDSHDKVQREELKHLYKLLA